MPPIGERVAQLEIKVDGYHTEVLRILHEEIVPLRAEVRQHTHQLTFWKGSFAVLTFLWTSLLAYFEFHRK